MAQAYEPGGLGALGAAAPSGGQIHHFAGKR